MTTQYIMQRDSNGWRLQVWLSFGIAIVACAAGAIQLPGQELDRAFVALGLFFSLFACFAVAKMIRDNRDGQIDTASWVMTVWAAFAAAIILTAWGLWRMNIPTWEKNYMVVSWLFLIASTFTLAKTIRDAHEVALMERANLTTASSSQDAPLA
ncbi:YiaA/YiaB family inner membrane protein [Undibacterium fentianense]|uniref:YiaAB two helix domain-containing protein n=1 Tax=Undibacterium fentianense TaxID=2828728 RepID=A0A941E9K3_9BURK|nr:YiaA/YiaB family inner membrane protein [Undibacterium fentianense]MBR7801113.1 hypothetical protein [Undibacterium fentianense]